MPARKLPKRALLNGLLALAAACMFVAVSRPSGALAGALAGATYYVATNGNDSNPGTQSAPWRTIQKAANTLNAGDTVVVQPGAYGERVQLTRSGASGSPITFVADGSVSMKGFTIKANYVAIKNFYITGAPNDSTNGYGIYVAGSHNLIENNHLYFNVRGGVILYAPASSPSSASYNVVRNNQLERNALCGVDIRGENNTVEWNDIWATVQYHPDWTDPPSYVDADGIRFHGGGHMIRHNRIHDISYAQPENQTPHIDCFQTWSDSSHEVAHDVTIEGNFCKNLETHAENENGQGFMLEGSTSNLVIENNVIQAYLAVNVHDSTGLQVVNNTILSSLSFTQYWPRGVRLVNSPNATVRNNIFVDVGSTGNAYLETDSASNSGLNAGYNLVYMSDGRTPPGSPRPNDLWKIDPRFVDRSGDDFHLQADSPAVDTGAQLTQVPEDGANLPRPVGSGWDRGAFEFTTATPDRTFLPFITIQRTGANGADVGLSWSNVTEDNYGEPVNVVRYEVRRGELAGPELGSEPYAVVTTITPVVSTTDAGVASDTEYNYYYVVRAIDSQDLPSKDSSPVAEFTYALIQG